MLSRVLQCFTTQDHSTWRQSAWTIFWVTNLTWRLPLCVYFFQSMISFSLKKSWWTVELPIQFSKSYFSPIYLSSCIYIYTCVCAYTPVLECSSMIEHSSRLPEVQSLVLPKQKQLKKKILHFSSIWSWKSESLIGNIYCENGKRHLPSTFLLRCS